MTFFPEAKEFIIAGGTFTSHAHSAEGQKGTCSFLFYRVRVDASTIFTLFV